ncbi:MAG: globin [Crocinitomix sp.]|nr:globin [Crocinitomix sp.]
MPKEIENRSDVSLLVRSFYAKIRKNDFLGPIFNTAIPENNWEAHLEKLTDFWETNLFGIPKFKGNPMQAHRNVDAANDHNIDMAHFGHWIQLWFETIDEHFIGEVADKAKRASRKMATGLFMGMKS